jgi:hypothetical protein
MSEDSRRRRRPLGTDIESVVKLSWDESAEFAKIVETPATDPEGRTYAERMREKAEKARRKHS